MDELRTRSTEELLRRIGRNLETMRLEARLQDAEVISRGGIKSSTWTNLKAGRNVTISNLIKALRGLDRLHLLEQLVDYRPRESPMSLVDGSKDRPVRRVRRKETSSPEDTEPFSWGDEI